MYKKGIKFLALILSMTMLIGMMGVTTYAANVYTAEETDKVVYLYTDPYDSSMENVITEVASGEDFYVAVNFAGNSTEAETTIKTFAFTLQYNPDYVSSTAETGEVEIAGGLAGSASVAGLVGEDEISVTWAAAAGLVESRELQESGTLFYIPFKAKVDLNAEQLSDFVFCAGSKVYEDDETLFSDQSDVRYGVTQVPDLTVEYDSSVEIAANDNPEVMKKAFTVTAVGLDGTKGNVTDYEIVLPKDGLKVGDNTVFIKFLGSAKAVEITAVAPRYTISAPTIADIVFGETPNPSATASMPEAAGTLTYKYSDAPDGEFTEEVPKTAGTWYVKAYSEDGTVESEATKFEILKAQGTATAEGVEVVAKEVSEDERTYTYDLAEIITVPEDAGTVTYEAKAGDETAISDVKVDGTSLSFTIKEPKTYKATDTITISITSTNYTFADVELELTYALTFDLLDELTTKVDVKLDPEEYSIFSGEELNITTDHDDVEGAKWVFTYVLEGGDEADGTIEVPTDAGTYDIYGYYYNFTTGEYGQATGKLTVEFVEDEDIGGSFTNPNVTVTQNADGGTTTTIQEENKTVEIVENADGSTTTTTTETKSSTEGDNEITTETVTVENSPVVEETTDEDGNTVVTTTETTTVTETVTTKDNNGNESTVVTETETVTETVAVTDEEGKTTETKVETVTVTEKVEKTEIVTGNDEVASRDTESESTTTTTTTTDAEGNVVQKIEGEATEKVTNYDANGNVTSIENTESKISGELTNGNGSVSQTSTTVVTDAEGNQVGYPVEKQTDSVYENGEIVDVTDYEKAHNEEGYYYTETSMGGTTLEGQYNEDGDPIGDTELNMSEADMLDALNDGEPYAPKTEMPTDTGFSIHINLPGGFVLDINNDGFVLASEMFSIEFRTPNDSVNNGVMVNGVLDKHSRRGSVIVPVAGDCEVQLVSNAKTFTDVDKNNEAIAFVTSREIFVGNGNGTFTPDQNMNRAMVAQILYNYDYYSAPNAARGAEFTDVNETDWYAEAIGWAAENNVVKGRGDASYGALDNITRQEFITILYRYAKTQGFNVTVKGQDDAAYIKSILGQFSDGDNVDDYAIDPMRWAVVNGVLTVNEDTTTLGAKDQITRAEVAEIIMNYVQNIY